MVNLVLPRSLSHMRYLNRLSNLISILNSFVFKRCNSLETSCSITSIRFTISSFVIVTSVTGCYLIPLCLSSTKFFRSEAIFIFRQRSGGRFEEVYNFYSKYVLGLIPNITIGNNHSYGSYGSNGYYIPDRIPAGMCAHARVYYVSLKADSFSV